MHLIYPAVVAVVVSEPAAKWHCLMPLSVS